MQHWAEMVKQYSMQGFCATVKGVFRTQSKIYDGAFFVKKGPS